MDGETGKYFSFEKGEYVGYELEDLDEEVSYWGQSGAMEGCSPAGGTSPLHASSPLQILF